jgi:hypothetical protein
VRRWQSCYNAAGVPPFVLQAKSYGPIASGALFGAGWWFWVDAVVCTSNKIPFDQVGGEGQRGRGRGSRTGHDAQWPVATISDVRNQRHHASVLLVVCARTATAAGSGILADDLPLLLAGMLLVLLLLPFSVIAVHPRFSGHAGAHHDQLHTAVSQLVRPAHAHPLSSSSSSRQPGMPPNTCLVNKLSACALLCAAVSSLPRLACLLEERSAAAWLLFCPALIFAALLLLLSLAVLPLLL